MIRNRVAPGYCENAVIQDDGGPADTSVFAGAPKRTGQRQNILLLVRSWRWTSMPIRTV